MEWNEIHDKRGEFVIKASHRLTSGLYDPDEVQSLIDNNGVIKAVSEINQAVRAHYGALAYLVTRVNGQSTVVDAPGASE